MSLVTPQSTVLSLSELDCANLNHEFGEHASEVVRLCAMAGLDPMQIMHDLCRWPGYRPKVDAAAVVEQLANVRVPKPKPEVTGNRHERRAAAAKARRAS